MRSSKPLIRQTSASRYDKARATDINAQCTLTFTLALWRTSGVQARKMQCISSIFTDHCRRALSPALTIFPVAVRLLTSVASVHSPEQVAFGIFYLVCETLFTQHAAGNRRLNVFTIDLKLSVCLYTSRPCENKKNVSVCCTFHHSK